MPAHAEQGGLTGYARYTAVYNEEEAGACAGVDCTWQAMLELDPVARDLLLRLLMFDPHRRNLAEEAGKHSFFSHFRVLIVPRTQILTLNTQRK